MQCLECGAEELHGLVTMQVTAPLTARTGSIKVGSVKLTQIDVKNQWDKHPTGEERSIKGPIYCMKCGHEMYYHRDKAELCNGNFRDAIERQYAGE